MNIRDFFWAYIGLWVESNKGSDTSTYDQCIDLWRVFNRKIIKAPDIFGNPPDIWAKYQSNYYEKIPNTPEGVPQLGDVIVWGTRYGKYGHIAICTELANTRNFTSFDQNDPLGSPCHFQPHTYAGVLGWLRPKNQALVAEPQPNEEVTKLEDKISDLEDKVKSGNEALAEKSLENNQLRESLEAQERDNKDLTDQILEARNQRDKAIGEQKILEKKVEELLGRVTSLEESEKALKTQLVASAKLENVSTLTLVREIIKRFLRRR